MRTRVATADARPDVVVAGGGFSGLLAAAAVARAGRRVVVFERRDRPDAGISIVPHGRFPHNLLAGGVRSLESLLPGIVGELVASGAQLAGPTTGHTWSRGRRLSKPIEARIPLSHRAVIESVVRQRVEADPMVTFRYGTRVAGLRHRGGRVAGVDVDGGYQEADLTVIATGRGFVVDRWFDAAGLAPPSLEEQLIDVTYVACFVDHPSGLGDHNWVVVQNLPPRWPRIGLAIRADAGTWGVVVGGYHGDRPAPGLEGMTAFARSLPDPTVARLLAHARPDTQVHTHRIRSNSRRRFDPKPATSGLLLFGDALCSFNPVFGQGMTVAALQASSLAAALGDERGEQRSNRELQALLNEPADEAWLAVTTLDGGYPDSTGVTDHRVLRHWHVLLADAATRDVVVAGQLDRVAALLAPARTLIRPTIVARSLRAVAGKRLPPLSRRLPSPPSSPTNLEEINEHPPQPTPTV